MIGRGDKNWMSCNNTNLKSRWWIHLSNEH